jgi:hypothetical protein
MTLQNRHESIAQFQDPRAEEKILDELSPLQPHLREIGYGLLYRDSAGKEIAQRSLSHHYHIRPAACRAWVALPSVEREQLVAIFFPNIQQTVLRGWKMHDTAPYLTGGNRIALRAPQQPELSRLPLAQWLESLLATLLPYRSRDIQWVAEYSFGFLTGRGWHHSAPMLLAAAIDADDEQSEVIFNTLRAIIRGEHPHGRISRGAIATLLTCARPEAWDLVEGLLIAAQRQEGLRQVILEAVDLAHPEAFRRIVRLVNQQGLVRFNSVIRAVDVWFQLRFDVTQTKSVQKGLTMLERFLDNPQLANQAVNEAAQEGYVALLALGFADVDIALDHAERLLIMGEADQRLMAARFTAITHTPRGAALLAGLLGDPDEHITAVALRGLMFNRFATGPRLFNQIVQKIPSLPIRAKTLPPRIWPWWQLDLDPKMVGDLLYQALGEQPRQLLFPYFHLLDSGAKQRLIRELRQTQATWDAETRQAILSWLGDRSRYVRQAAAAGLTGLVLTPAEMSQLEKYLTRKATDLRQTVLISLLAQPDTAVFPAAQRLLAATHPLQRQAGLELLARLFAAARQPEQCRHWAAAYQAERDTLTPTEHTLFEKIIPQDAPNAAPVSIANGLGLIDHARRTPPTLPRPLPFSPTTKIATALLQSLDLLISAHKDVEITAANYSGKEETYILGDLRYRWQFPVMHREQSRAENLARLPLRNVWLEWWAAQQSPLAGGDGFDLIRALAAALAPRQRNKQRPPAPFAPDPHVREQITFPFVVLAVLDWIVWYAAPRGALDFALDGVEFTFWHLLQSDQFAEQWRHGRWQHTSGDIWLSGYQRLRALLPAQIADRHHLRLWRLLRWRDEPTAVLPPPEAGFRAMLRHAFHGPLTEEAVRRRLLGEAAEQYTRMPRNRPSLTVLMEAYERGAANDQDLIDLLIGPPPDFYKKPEATETRRFFAYHPAYLTLRTVSRRRAGERGGKFDFHPAVQTAVEKIRRRIIEIELQRGDLPTSASRPARSLRYAGGGETLLQLLCAFGKQLFVRAYAFDGESKKAVFSHLIRATFPTDADTVARFAELANQAAIPEKRLIETAMYAPQWATHIEHVTGWTGLAEAVWWFHAHTKDRQWQVDQEIRAAWAAEIDAQTPLKADELLDGAVDVAWFNRAYKQLGAKRWTALHKAAKYASGSGGHKRAQLFAQAMLGKLAEADLVKRIKSKRHQDSVRALGLLPLPETRSKAALLERYLLLQEFARGSKKFGSQRQASERLAVRIGMDNLARSAGYADPLRLEWAMEQHAVADLAAGAVSVNAENITVSLAIDAVGEPQISVTRQLKSGRDKPLKNIPATLKKQPAIAELAARKTVIRRQAARTRRSLEAAMIRGEGFTGAELGDLLRHPVLKPMLQQLVFVNADGEMGYPMGDGSALADLRGRKTAVPPTACLRIAHPHDFLNQDWHLWQRDCFQHERIQPFKQIFRELYLLTPAEQETGTFSRRYAGQEVNPKQALALFTTRGWVSHPEEGTRKTDHAERITAHVGMRNGTLTPAEIGGMTIEHIHFSKRGEWTALPLADVPPRLFSETMRDLDLVVSVAHLAGVDPEATQSSLAARGALVRETAVLLNLSNVTVKTRHVIIDGQLGSYSIHLGSGVVHQRPGGTICIIPVHNAQRGRVFLPFVDNDPQTAEIIAKTVLLARDREIQDPTILEQLHRQ